MNYKYLYIESKNSIKENIPTIIEIFQAILNIEKYEEFDKELILYYTISYVDTIKEVMSNLVEDMYIDLRVYESKNYKTMAALKSDFSYVKTKLKEIPFYIDNYHNNKSILSFNLTKIDNQLEKLILGSYYNNHEMLKTVKVFLENNQNSSTASKELYVHRNTLNQRLEKFISETNFNVKNFKDAFLIYHLLK